MPRSRSATASVRQMRRFIGDASHELRTPLVTVRGYAELYRMGAISGDEDVAQAMDRIEKEAMRMGVLVEDLLALARLDERRDVDHRPGRPAPDRTGCRARRARDLPAAPGHGDRHDDRRAPAGAPQPPAEAAPDREPRAAAADRRPRPSRAPGGGALSLLRRKPRPVPAAQATTGDRRACRP